MFQKIRYLKMENNSFLVTSDTTNITDSENHELESLEFAVEGILIPVLTCLGLVGNILSLTVLHSPGVDMKVNNTVSIFLAVSQLPVVRSEHVRTLFDSTQSQEYKSEVSLRNRTRQCALGPILRHTLYLWYLGSNLNV